jgi:AcrR family transcriptional regulator
VPYNATVTPQTKTGKEPEQQGGSRLETIQDAAVTLFDRRGYNGTRMKDIGAHLGIQAPSLYNHVASKQKLLHDIMFAYIEGLLHEHELAMASSSSVVERLRRGMEAHVRYTSRHTRQTRIGAREVPSLVEPARTELLDLRSEYARSWQALLDEGVEQGEFVIPKTQLAANALLQMGLGVALWIRPLPLSESELVYTLGEMALRAVGVQNPAAVND